MDFHQNQNLNMKKSQVSRIGKIIQYMVFLRMSLRNYKIPNDYKRVHICNLVLSAFLLRYRNETQMSI